MPQCTATAKSTDERCKSYSCIGYTVCRMHGGGRSGIRSGDDKEDGGRMERFMVMERKISEIAHQANQKLKMREQEK